MVPVFIVSAVVFAHFAHYGHDARLVLWLATGATLFTLLDEPLLMAFQAKERMEYMAYSDVINKSAQGLVGIVIVVIGFGAIGLTASWLVVSIWCSYWVSDGQAIGDHRNTDHGSAAQYDWYGTAPPTSRPACSSSSICGSIQ